MTVLGGPRTVFAAALLMTLSAFAKETATVVKDLPKPSPAHAPAASGEAAVPAPKAKASTLSRIRKPLSLFSGMASWYGKVLENHHTASGQRFDMFALTAAHRSLPFGSKVKVTDLRNRKSVIVTITDRGVLSADRVIDLSFGAAQQLDMIKTGVDPVRLEVLTAREAERLLAEALPQ
jgi:rare lipoprotein A